MNVQLLKLTLLNTDLQFCRDAFHLIEEQEGRIQKIEYRLGELRDEAFYQLEYNFPSPERLRQEVHMASLALHEEDLP